MGWDADILWRCAKSWNCSGCLKTINNEIISSRVREHNHSPDTTEMTTCKVKGEMKGKVKESIDQLRSIYQQQLVEVSARVGKFNPPPGLNPGLTQV